MLFVKPTFFYDKRHFMEIVSCIFTVSLSYISFFKYIFKLN